MLWFDAYYYNLDIEKLKENVRNKRETNAFANGLCHDLERAPLPSLKYNLGLLTFN